MPAIFVLIIIPLLFYILIPAAGAFRVRKIWRLFRTKMIDSSFFPICDYKDIIASQSEGYYRFFGEIEAVQSDGYIWVKNSSITMSVKMKHCHIYMIPSEKKRNSQMPIKLPWNRVFSIAEGTAIYISGEVIVENGRVAFSGTRKDPLTVILYDGEIKTLLERSISCGRQKNEYWNFLTPWSIASGGIISLLLLDMMIKASVSSSILIFGIIVSSLPIIPFIPPGLLFFYLYSNMWKKGRLCRSDRDLVSLPLRFEERNIIDSSYVHIKFNDENPVFPVIGEYTVRKVQFDKKVISDDTLWNNSVFGKLVSLKDGRWLCAPNDPMKEFLMIKDDPYVLIQKSNKKAFRFEVLSLISFFLAMSMNIVIFVQVIKVFM